MTYGPAGSVVSSATVGPDTEKESIWSAGPAGPGSKKGVGASTSASSQAPAPPKEILDKVSMVQVIPSALTARPILCVVGSPPQPAPLVPVPAKYITQGPPA